MCVVKLNLARRRAVTVERYTTGPGIHSGHVPRVPGAPESGMSRTFVFGGNMSTVFFLALDFGPLFDVFPIGLAQVLLSFDWSRNPYPGIPPKYAPSGGCILLQKLP